MKMPKGSKMDFFVLGKTDCMFYPPPMPRGSKTDGAQAEKHNAVMQSDL